MQVFSVWPVSLVIFLPFVGGLWEANALFTGRSRGLLFVCSTSTRFFYFFRLTKTRIFSNRSRTYFLKSTTRILSTVLFSRYLMFITQVTDGCTASSSKLTLRLINLPNYLFLTSNRLRSNFARTFSGLRVLFTIRVARSTLYGLFASFIRIGRIIRHDQFRIISKTRHAYRFLNRNFTRGTSTRYGSSVLMKGNLQFLCSLCSILNQFFSRTIRTTSIYYLRHMRINRIIGRSLLVRLISNFQSRPFSIRNATTSRVLSTTLCLYKTAIFIHTMVYNFILMTCRSTTTFQAIYSRDRLLTSFQAYFLIRSHGLQGSFTTLFRMRRVTRVRIRQLSSINVIREDAFRRHAQGLGQFRVNRKDCHSHASRLVHRLRRFNTDLFHLGFVDSNPTQQLNHRARITLLTL